MNEREEFKLGAANNPERPRLSRATRVGKRAKAKVALSGQHVRAAASLVRAFTEKKLTGAFSKAKTVGKAKALRRVRCPVCGNRLADNARFCAACGTDASVAPLVKVKPEAAMKKPMLLQRIAGQLIDRLLPIPFLVLVDPKWIWIVGAYHLLCEVWAGRSPGKLLCRTRVVDAKSLKKCGAVRGLLRRVGLALGQMAYCRWELVPLALVYDFVSFLFVWRDRAGRRLEDMLLGLRVISERQYRKLKRECTGCGAIVSARTQYCPRCGKRSGR